MPSQSSLSIAIEDCDMRFYTTQHQFYCGIGLHARAMYARQQGPKRKDPPENLSPDPEAFLRAIIPYCSNLVVAVACTYIAFFPAEAAVSA